MQMPSTAQNTHFSRMERNNSTSLHNKLANFVLELQTDVRLEDLLENCSSVDATQKQNIPAERREVHIKHLRHLYNEIKKQQKSTFNAHEQPSKRQHDDNTSEFGNKTLRKSDCFLLHETDCLDETWLLNFASQLGLDKKMDLPELNIDLMQELL